MKGYGSYQSIKEQLLAYIQPDPKLPGAAPPEKDQEKPKLNATVNAAEAVKERQKKECRMWKKGICRRSGSVLAAIRKPQKQEQKLNC